MPIYEYQCRSCGEQFEFLVLGQDQPVCPACGGHDLDKQMSAPAAPHQAGSDRCASLANRPCDAGGGCNGCPCTMRPQ